MMCRPKTQSNANTLTPGIKNTTATRFDLILDRQREWQERLDMVAQAERFLYISMYYIEYDYYGITFLDNLIKARRRGVSVTLLVDGFGQKLSGNLMTKETKGALKQKIAVFTACGGRMIYHRPQKILQRLLGTGYHTKYQISEKGICIFASGNISQMSFDRWFEFALVVCGPVVVEMLEDFLEALPSVQRKDEQALQIIKTQAMKENDADIAIEFVAYHPSWDQSALNPILQKNENAITQELIKSINAAQENILITSFYYKPAARLGQAILNAARRGVAIEIHHSHRDALGGVTKLPWIAAIADYPDLLREHIRIYEHVLGQHTKFILIDDEVLWLGSYNLEHAADERLAEAMIKTTDSKTISIIQEFFEALREDPLSEFVEQDYLPKLPVALKIYRLACLPIKRWI